MPRALRQQQMPAATGPFSPGADAAPGAGQTGLVRHRPDAMVRGTQSALDRLTRIVGNALDVPAVCAALVDTRGQLMTSSYGLSAAIGLLVSYSFRAHVTASRRPLVMVDGPRDPLLARHPAVRDGTVVACVGMPLHRTDGRLLGSLLAMDRRPRRWSGPELALLDRLSALVTNEIEMAAAWRRLAQESAPATGPSVC